MGAMGLAVMITVAQVLGALPSSLPVDSASLDALMAGRDVCGDAENREACLLVAECDDVDPLLECTAAEPVWLPGTSRGGVGERDLLFRRVLPVPALPHPNYGSLTQSKNQVVGSPVYFDGSPCPPGAMPAEAAFDAVLKWAASHPWVERRRSFSECSHCSADASRSCAVLHHVLVCMGYDV